jgi:surface protein
MFEGCSNLTSLDLRTFDTSGAYYFNDMFNGCTKLTSVNLSGWDTSNSTHWMRMFKNCTSLRNIDIAHFDATYTQNITGMFQGCTNITIAIANSNNAIDMRNITTYNNFIENIGTVTVRYSSNVRVYNSFIKADFPRANWVDVG